MQMLPDDDSASFRYRREPPIEIETRVGRRHSLAWLAGIRRVMLVAMARKLAITFWRYVETGLVPEGIEVPGMVHA